MKTIFEIRDSHWSHDIVMTIPLMGEMVVIAGESSEGMISPLEVVHSIRQGKPSRVECTEIHVTLKGVTKNGLSICCFGEDEHYLPDTNYLQPIQACFLPFFDGWKPGFGRFLECSRWLEKLTGNHFMMRGDGIPIFYPPNQSRSGALSSAPPRRASSS